jgi:polygalacturonase
VDVGDDCVTIKSGTEEDGRANLRACENLTITNCTMLHGHGGVVMGSEMSGGVRNVAISNCIFSGTDRGIRLKSRRGRGNAIEDLRVDNIVMDDVLCPMSINLFYECGAEGSSRVTDQSAHPVDDGTPRFRRLRFSNILARRVKYAAGYVLGLPEMAVEDVTFDNISVYLDPDNTKGGAPVMAPNIPDMCRAGIIVKNGRNIKLRRIDVLDQKGPAISITNCQDIGIGDLYARRDGASPIVEMDGREVGERTGGR